MKEDIINYNNKGQLHGYYERYWGKNITIKVNYKNDNRIGYGEFHYTKITRYYIK